MARTTKAESAVIPRESMSTHAQLYAKGKALRDICPRAAHAEWKAPKDRRDPVDMVLVSEKGRIPELLPLRHGRMVQSAFTFYRGSALAMAADLCPRPQRESASSVAGTLISVISAVLPQRSGRSSSPSTISTRHYPHRGNGMSSASQRALWSPAGTGHWAMAPRKIPP